MPKSSKTNTEDFRKSLTEALTKSQRPPFLFIGSGISIRYCSIPTWINLLKGFVAGSKCFTYNFGYYSSKCSNDPLKIASMLAEEYHSFWWRSEDFSDSRNQYEDIAGRHTENAFKIELSKFVQRSVKIRDENKSEMALISSAVISGILTTNWDNFLQTTFPDFQVEIGQKEAIFADQRSIGELYKIHGCISKPESLVVTNSDYENFISNNHYLNAKLLTLFAEYPIIFMGYSLSDPNIEAILNNLISCLDKDLFHVDKLRDRLFFVEWVNKPCSPSMEYSTYTMKSITIPLIKIKLHDFSDVWNVLSKLPRTLSVKTLRHLQSMIFDFVYSSVATGKILVNGIDELDSIDNLEVVVGFGNISKLEKKGIVGLKSADLMKDLLFDDIPHSDHLEIVQNLLHTLVHKNIFVPIFKYNRTCENINSDNSLKNYVHGNYTLSRADKISIEDYRVESERSRATRLVKKYATITDLLDDSTPVQAIQRIPFMEREKIQIDLLEEFLKTNWLEFGDKDHSYSSAYRKCICLLDYLKYAN